MSVFSVSRIALLVVAVPAAAALLVVSPPSVQAARARVTISADGSGGTDKHIQIDKHGITVTTLDSTTADTLTVVRRGGIDAGGIVVRGNGNGIVRLFSDASVAPGERVDGDVVAVFGSVTVEGEVAGSTVAVFGSVDLGPDAKVHGDAVAVGGGLREAPGSHVSGQAVQVGFLPLTLGLPGLPIVLATILLGWLVSLFFGWLAAALFPTRLARVAVMSSRRTAASLALGIASGPLMLVTMVLLLVTVIGIPIAVFLPFLYIGVVYLGQIAAMYVLGCKLTRRRLGEGNFTAPLVSGSLLVTSIFGFSAILWQTPGIVRTVALFFLLVAALLSIGLAVIGTGAFILSRAGSRPLDVGGPVPPAPAPVPAAPPVL